ncbi:FtsX-like permease family protein [Chloroflexi bacterium TSY]|nr:FtsX-like permease family protein [Chloroflexi bacterium TSY]
MLRALFRQAMADLRHRRLYTTQLFVVVLLSAFAITFTVGIRQGAQRVWQHAFVATNGAHSFYMTNAENVDLAPITQLDDVVEFAGPYPMLETFPLAQDPQKIDLQLLGLSSDPPAVNRPLVVEGRWLAEDGMEPQDGNGGDAGAIAGEIVLDVNFARTLDIEVGTSVDLLTDQGQVTLHVVGLVINTSWAYPVMSLTAAYVLPSTLLKIEPDQQAWRSILYVRLANPNVVGKVNEQASNLFTEGAISYDFDWQRVQFFVLTWSSIAGLSLSILGLFIILAGGLIIANVTSAIVLAQVREIGLLKAIGFTPRQVTALFLLENLMVGLIATLVGLLLGIFISSNFLMPTLLHRAAILLDVPGPVTFSPLWSFAILLAIESIVAFFTLLPAWRAGQTGTLDAITTRVTQAQRQPSRLTWLADRLLLPIAVSLGLKDTFVRPWRAWFTVISLMLVVSIVTAVVISVDTISEQYNRAFYIEPGTLADAAVRQILDQRPEIDGYLANKMTMAQVVGQNSQILATALDGPTDQFPYLIPKEGRRFAAPGEAMLTRRALNRLGLNIGDTLPLVIDDEALDLQIVGRHVDFRNDGMITVFSLETLRQGVDPVAEPTEYQFKLAPGADFADLQAVLLRESDGQFGVGNPVSRDIVEAIRLQTMVNLVSGALLMIVLLNLLTTIILSVQERIHDFGILKAIGLTPRQIALSVASSMSLLALLAVPTGIVVGIIVTRVLWGVIGQLTQDDTSAITTVVNWGTLALLLPGTILLAVLSSIIPARQAAKLPVSEALRYE